jgi:UDP-hydrolysing UDP-N-acetyl-D-glucosamine 2-epimerase
VVVTARPSYSRIRSALFALKKRADLQLQLLVAASALLERYGNMVQVIQNDGFTIDERVYMVVEGENLVTMAKTTGLGLLEMATAFDNLQPDLVVTVADRYETLATAIAASHMNIPLVHVQGGEVTGSIDDKVRDAVTMLADFHCVATARAAERVRCMGAAPSRVFLTGCPSIDLALDVLKAPRLDFDPFEKYGGVGERVDLSRGYIVVMQHPVTTEYELAMRHVEETLSAVAALDLPALWFWPNVDAGSDGTSKGIRRFRELRQPKNIHFFKNMLPQDFLRLVFNSRGIVGNSSVALRECSFLGVPAVNVGSRQAGRERGRNVIDVYYDRGQIQAAIERHLKNGRLPGEELYGDGNAGERMAEVLAAVPLDAATRLSD